MSLPTVPDPLSVPPLPLNAGENHSPGALPGVDEALHKEAESIDEQLAHEAQRAIEQQRNDVKTYQRRARLGAVAMGVRSVLTQVIVWGGTVVLANRLTPGEFGVFGILQMALSALTLFGDAGLAGALVQQKESPTRIELASVFYVQLGLGAAVVAAAFAIGPYLRVMWPALPDAAPWILIALALNFVFTSLRVVPTLLLERELHFVRVAILDTLNQVTFFLVASILALQGFRVWSLAFGVLAQGAVSFVVAFSLRPWKPSWAFEFAEVRKLLAFGLPFQLRNGLGLGVGGVISVVGGSMLGSTAVGYVNWALQTAFFPLNFIDLIARINFALFSRLRQDPEAFRAALARSLRISVALTFGTSAIFIGVGDGFTRIVYGAQWIEAVPLLWIFAATIPMGMLINTLCPAFDAIAKPRLVLLQISSVLVLTWIVVPLATQRFGIRGLVVGYVSVMVVGGFITIALARRHLPVTSILSSFPKPLFASVVAAFCGRRFIADWIQGPVQLVLGIAAVFVIYAGLAVLLDRKLIGEIRAMKTAS